jgi:hypothetical protein
MNAESTQITSFRNLLPDSLKQISEWSYDIDFDDYVSMFDDEGSKTNYKVIVELLILLHTYKDDCKQFVLENNDFLMIKNLITECKSQNKMGCYIQAIINQLGNIIELHSNLKMLGTFYDVGYNGNNYILLYRGFNFSRYKSLISDVQNLQLGDIYTTPTFLSTTVLDKIAMSFVSNLQTIENNVLWCIRVEKEFLKQLQYSYIGNNISNIFDLQSIIDTKNYESEILLDFGAQLRLTNVRKIHNITYIYKTVKIINKSFTLYEFEFVGFNLQKSASILTKVSDLKKCLENISGRSITKRRSKRSSPSFSSKKSKQIME